ncbi:MAG: DUF433 domain-containing protein [Pseudomonadota bacterium]
MGDDRVIQAFSEEQTSRLTGVSQRQLQSWDRTGFFSPSFADKDRRFAYSRVYSFQDLASLRVLNTLRNEVGCSLQHLREVKEKLDLLSPAAWAETTLYVLNKRVVFVNSTTKLREDATSGQLILQIPLKVVKRDIEDAVQSLWERDPSCVGKVSQKKNVASSERVVAGTRVSVRAIKAFADAGYSVEMILEQYPSLTTSDIRAALGDERAA